MLPKGTSFDSLNQADITKVNHINSTTKVSLTTFPENAKEKMILSHIFFGILEFQISLKFALTFNPAIS